MCFRSRCVLEGIPGLSEFRVCVHLLGQWWCSGTVSQRNLHQGRKRRLQWSEEIGSSDSGKMLLTSYIIGERYIISVSLNFLI